MGTDSVFKVEQEGHIAWLTLDRPEKRNAMGYAFYQGMTEHFTQFD
jgi:enoyl-CoA hydratase/carnithine racemase